MQKIAGTIVPCAYEAWGDGIYARTAKTNPVNGVEPDLDAPCPPERRGLLSQVTTAPVWLSEFGRTVSGAAEVVRLAGRSPQGGTYDLWLDRTTIADRRGLLTLASAGVPVHAENAGGVVEYLAAMEAANRGVLPCRTIGDRAGWHETPAGGGWMIGEEWIGPGSVATDPRELGPFARGYVMRGVPAAWIRRWRQLRELGPVVRWLMGTTFAAPLIRPLGGRSFFVHLHGGALAGKSALCKYLMSAWGDPERLSTSWNTTENAAVDIYAHVSDLPVLFDERQAARAKLDIGQIIHATCEETGRNRAARFGGLRRHVPQWKVLVLATGNQTLVTREDLGGGLARVLELYVGAEGSRLVPNPRELHRFVRGHHGHVGRMFLRELAPIVNDPASLARLVELYDTWTQRLGDHYPHMGEQASLVATVCLAQALAEWWILHAGVQAVWDRVREEAIQDAHAVMGALADDREEDLATRAAEILNTHRVEHPTGYIDASDPNWQNTYSRSHSVVAFVFPTVIYYLPSAADAILERGGLPGSRVWRELAHRGWLEQETHDVDEETGGRRHRTVRLRVCSSRFRVFGVHRARLEGLRVLPGGLVGGVEGAVGAPDDEGVPADD